MSLDAYLEFPCDFPLKVLGHHDQDFDALVATVVRRHVHDLGEGAVVARPSSGGRFVSVTVHIRAESQQQIEAIYRDLHATPGVLMLL